MSNTENQTETSTDLAASQAAVDALLAAGRKYQDYVNSLPEDKRQAVSEYVSTLPIDVNQSNEQHFESVLAAVKTFVENGYKTAAVEPTPTPTSTIPNEAVLPVTGKKRGRPKKSNAPAPPPMDGTPVAPTPIPPLPESGKGVQLAGSDL